MKRNFVIILSVCIALLVTVFRMDTVANDQHDGLVVAKGKISKTSESKLKRDVYICHSLVAKVNTGKNTSAELGRESNNNFESANKANKAHSLMSYKRACVKQRLYILNCAHLL
ncbi:hypothetical protein QTN47_18345 [Danxiaibacter flavus]|uniref:Uncharacterized protein n=1 Tax=Danxiaibacter flavus TaxID=3049108 RepID=A0ABV3ZJZ5_9BACT|nr:hypothetical protein QNM32_18355 [Chitinophagaceae bacterium DXS]